MCLWMLHSRVAIWHAGEVSAQPVIIWFISKVQGGKVAGNGLECICRSGVATHGYMAGVQVFLKWQRVISQSRSDRRQHSC